MTLKLQGQQCELAKSRSDRSSKNGMSKGESMLSSVRKVVMNATVYFTELFQFVSRLGGLWKEGKKRF